MIKQIENLINNKKDCPVKFDNLIYVCQGGSHIAGTNDDTSDFDFRSIAIPSDDYVIGIDKFEHTKVVTGKNKINQFEDFDLEIFSFDYFINQAANGEVIPTEMLWVDNKYVHKKSDIMNLLLDNRDLFLSKNVVFRYMGFVIGCINRAFLPIEIVEKDAKRPDRIERVRKYGYETKFVMNAIKCLRICVGLLKNNQIELYREDKEELLDIKNGKLGHFDKGITEAKKVIYELEQEKECLLQQSSLPKRVNKELVNKFKKDFFIKVIKEVYGY